jgi:hypothetical protein
MNWKTFVETYLEVYHVNPYHPGLGNFTDCENFSVDYGEEYSIQIVAAKAGLERPGTPVYRKWHEACLQQLDGRTPKYGALWASYFPGLTFEWYPNVLVVSHLIPRSADAHHERGRVLLPRGNRAVRARIHRGAAGGLRRDRARGLRDLPAPRPRPPRALPAGARTTPVRTSRRWKTRRFTSMNGSTLVSTDEVEKNLAHWRVFDCRHDLAKPALGEQQYREGHLPGAMFAHLERDLSGKKTGKNGRHPLPEPGEFEKWLETTGLAPRTR